MQYKDYYEILEVERKATQEDIKRSYRRLAKLYHPDTNCNDKEAEDKIKDINEAYSVLSDVDKRKKYNALTRDFKFWENIDLSKFKMKKKEKKSEEKQPEEDVKITSEFFETFFGEDSASLDDFFGTIRGTRRAQRRKFVEKYYKSNGLNGTNVEVDLELTLQEAYNGVDKDVRVIQLDGTSKYYIVHITAGIRDGEKLRLPELGIPNKDKSKIGDLFVTVHVKEDNNFELRGNDIYTKLCVSPWEAVIGDTVKVKTLNGEIDVRIPRNVQTGNVIKLKGYGFRRENTFGDMYCEVVVVVPPRPTNEELRLFECLRSVSTFNPRDRK